MSSAVLTDIQSVLTLAAAGEPHELLRSCDSSVQTVEHLYSSEGVT